MKTALRAQLVQAARVLGAQRRDIRVAYASRPWRLRLPHMPVYFKVDGKYQPEGASDEKSADADGRKAGSDDAGSKGSASALGPSLETLLTSLDACLREAVRGCVAAAAAQPQQQSGVASGPVAEGVDEEGIVDGSSAGQPSPAAAALVPPDEAATTAASSLLGVRKKKHIVADLPPSSSPAAASETAVERHFRLRQKAAAEAAVVTELAAFLGHGGGLLADALSRFHVGYLLYILEHQSER